MRYLVLGPIGIATDAGETVAIGGDRQTALVAALVARRGQVVSADQLIELLWSDDAPRRPANALQVLVSRLRTAARSHGADLVELETKAPGYMLSTAASATDAADFERLVAEADATSGARKIELLTRALAMWRGRPYGEFADVDIARLEAIRLSELKRTAQIELGQALVDAGRSQEASALLEPFVAEHPLDEAARGALMRALYAMGRHPEALAVYQDYRTVLGEDLGLEPSGALQQLEMDILRHEMPDSPATRGTGSTASLASIEVRYLPIDDAAIAWTHVGSGPDLVVVPAWVTSLDVIASGRDPRSSLLERLAGRARLVLYDRRGTGLSRAPVDDYSVAAASDELEAIIEASGHPSALLAMSQAGPAALAVAARRPDLVSSLVLFGTFASGPATFGNPELVTGILEVVRSHWGVGSRMLAGLYRPDASDAAAEHLGRVLRDSASREVAAGYLESVYTTDVSDVLQSLTCPALVVHYRGDRVIPFVGGSQIASAIPDARLIALDGPYHLPDAADLDRIVNAISDFLAD